MRRAAPIGLILGTACGGSILLGNNDRVHSGDAGGAGSTIEAGECTLEDAGCYAPSGSDDGGSPASASMQADADDGTSESGADTPCLDTQFSPRNCGVCGHDCMGGACQAGVCVPLPPGVLASGQLSPSSIVVDDTNVYWINEGIVPTVGPAANVVIPPSLAPRQIMKCAKTGCNNHPTVIFSEPQGGGTATAFTGLAVDGANLYWSSAIFGLARCAIDGCNGPPDWFDQSGSSVISVDTKNIYSCFYAGCGSIALMGDGGPRARSDLWRGPIADGSVPLSDALGVAIDSLNAYSLGFNGTLAFCPLSGCHDGPIFLATTPGDAVVTKGAAQFSIDATNIYWSMGRIAAGDTPRNVADGEVLRCPKGGCNGTPIVVATGLANPIGVTSDGANVYFTELGTSFTSSAMDGRVAKCVAAGCSNQPTPIAEHVGYPHGVAVDTAHVYWTEYGSAGEVNRQGLHQSADGRVAIAPK
jgi:hypothetical protein